MADALAACPLNCGLKTHGCRFATLLACELRGAVVVGRNPKGIVLRQRLHAVAAAGTGGPLLLAWRGHMGGVGANLNNQMGARALNSPGMIRQEPEESGSVSAADHPGCFSYSWGNTACETRVGCNTGGPSGSRPYLQQKHVALGPGTPPRAEQRSMPLPSIAAGSQTSSSPSAAQLLAAHRGGMQPRRACAGTHTGSKQAAHGFRGGCSGDRHSGHEGPRPAGHGPPSPTSEPRLAPSMACVLGGRPTAGGAPRARVAAA
jgi:hypothetical protein